MRSIVQELDERAAARLDRLAVLPAQFQEFVPGIDARVNLVGDRISPLKSWARESTIVTRLAMAARQR